MDKPLDIPAYGFMIMIAFIVGTYLAVFRAKRWGLDPVHVVDAGLYAVIFGVIGAAVLFRIQYFDVFYWGEGINDDGTTYNKFWNIFKIWQGGLVFYGGLICATTAIMVMLKKRKQSIPLMSDLFLPSAILGLAITRIGCFFNGCCFGRACALPWAVTFPKLSHAHTRQLEQLKEFIVEHSHLFEKTYYSTRIDSLERIIHEAAGGIHSSRAIGILRHMKEYLVSKDLIEEGIGSHIHSIIDSPIRSLPVSVHPAQLYASLSAFAIFGILLFITRYKKFDGQIGCLVGISYAVNRFILELFRSDNATNLGLTISQWISFGILSFSLFCYLHLMKKGEMTKLPLERSQESGVRSQK